MSNAIESTGRKRLELLAGQRVGPMRYFFVALGVFYLIVAITGFSVSYRDHIAGTFPIHWFTHVHGGLMASWLLLYIIQANLIAFGFLKLHRRLGHVGVCIAALAWISMCIVSIRVRWTDNPPTDSFLWDILLVELTPICLFPLFVTSALLLRRHPHAHKRLIVFSAAVVLQAAIDRISWLPDFALPGHWGKDIWMYVILMPVVVYDLVTTGRVHRITLFALMAVIIGHLFINLFWGTHWWHQLSYGCFNALRP